MVTAGAGDMGQEEAEVQDRTAQELQSQSEQGVTVRHQAVRERSVEGARPTPHKNPVRPFLFQTKKRSQTASQGHAAGLWSGENSAHVLFLLPCAASP